MTTLLYTHPACLEHDPGPYHPESPARLRAVLEALDAPEFARLERREAPEAAIEDLARVHPRAFVERLLAAEEVPPVGEPGAGLNVPTDILLCALQALGDPLGNHRFFRSAAIA